MELSPEDFEELTENGRLTTSGSPGGEDIDPDGFEYMIWSQVCVCVCVSVCVCVCVCV